MQQSPIAMQLPPAALHVGPASGDGGGGGGGAAGTHFPASWPGTTAHALPAQQSLVDVQRPFVATHVGPPPGAGGWQRRTPAPSGKHGVPPQHSDEKVHCAPAAMQHGALPV
jgi:hypothetical protein